MLFGETVAVYCENHTEHTNRLSEQNGAFNYVKSGGTYSNHWFLSFKEFKIPRPRSEDTSNYSKVGIFWLPCSDEGAGEAWEPSDMLMLCLLPKLKCLPLLSWFALLLSLLLYFPPLNGFEVSVAWHLKSAIFWDQMPCTLFADVLVKRTTSIFLGPESKRKNQLARLPVTCAVLS
jgi:hypothetical protein